MTSATPTPPSPENSDSSSTVGKTTDWADLEFPCNLLIKEKDIAGVTENQPIQTIADAATQDNAFLRTFKLGWIKVEYYELLQTLPLPQPKE